MLLFLKIHCHKYYNEYQFYFNFSINKTVISYLYYYYLIFMSHSLMYFYTFGNISHQLLFIYFYSNNLDTFFVFKVLNCLLLISSMCKSNCDRVPTNDFLQVFGDERLSLDEDRLIEFSRSKVNDFLDTGLGSGLLTVFTLLCTVTIFTTTILPFFRPSRL